MTEGSGDAPSLVHERLAAGAPASGYRQSQAPVT